jgi:hypothetical protein
MHTSKNRILRAVAPSRVGLVLIAACAAGCAATNRSAKPDGLSIPVSTPTSLRAEHIPAESVPGLGPAFAGAEYARLDASMNLYAPETAFQRSAWRADPRPTLDRRRTITIDSSPTRFMYFRTERLRGR